MTSNKFIKIARNIIAPSLCDIFSSPIFPAYPEWGSERRRHREILEDKKSNKRSCMCQIHILLINVNWRVISFVSESLSNPGGNMKKF